MKTSNEGYPIVDGDRGLTPEEIDQAILAGGIVRTEEMSVEEYERRKPQI